MANPKFNPKYYHQVSETLLSKGLVEKELGNKLGHEYHYSTGGKIIIYKTGSVNFQAKSDVNELLRSIWNQSCQCFEATYSAHSEDVVKKNNTLVYYVFDDKIEALKDHILEVAEDIELDVSTSFEKTAVYRFIILDKLKNKITITQYQKKAKAASSKLLLQGLDSEVWDNITNSVGSFLGMTFQTAVAKLKVSIENNGTEVEVLSVVTTQEKKDAEELTKEKLGSCYNFLTDYDKDHIVSSQYMFISDIKPLTYFAFVSGTIRAYEGFVKKFIIDLEVFTLEEVQSRTWDFGQIYHKTTGLPTIVTLKLSTDPHLLNKQKNYVQRMVTAIYKHRNPAFHNTPPVPRQYQTIQSAETVHNELLDLMREASVLFGTVVK